MENTVIKNLSKTVDDIRGPAFFELSQAFLTEYLAWSDRRYGGIESKGPSPFLQTLEPVIEGIRSMPRNIDGYADAMFLFLEALRRSGYGCAELEDAMRRRFDFYKNRENKNG